MLLPDNIHPEDSIYYNGAFVLKAIQIEHSQDFLDLYLNTKHLKEMSLPVFILCLDWLYLLNLVTLNDFGRVDLCS
jgi:hypothetical protein